MVVVFGVLLVCCVTVVVVWGVGLVTLVVLSEKHDVSSRVIIKLGIPIIMVVFIGQPYSRNIA